MRTPDELRRELDADERAALRAVWMRTIACQMADARGRRVSARIGATSSTGELCEFAASGSTIEFPGFFRAYVEGADDPDAELEDRTRRRSRPSPTARRSRCDALDLSSHTTQPPARYTEASLMKELEERGIGRPSTYAAVVGTIQDRGYVWRKGNTLVPSWTGFASVQLLERHFAPLVDYGFTAEMEEDLDLIARHESESETWLNSFYFGNGATGLRELVSDEHLTAIDAREVNTIPLGVDGEGNEVAVRVGRYGPYLQRGDDTAPLPEDLAPDELTIEDALERLDAGPMADGCSASNLQPASRSSRATAATGRTSPLVSTATMVRSPGPHRSSRR